MKGGSQERVVYRNKEQCNLSKVTTTAKTGVGDIQTVCLLGKKKGIEKHYLTAMTWKTTVELLDGGERTNQI